MTLVRAAGGVLLRRGRGDDETCLVHRPRYDDWSLPKGKLDEDESFEEAALREVAEETGYECRLGPALGEIRYRDSRDRPKIVRYWVMWPIAGDGEFVADHEVDRIRWVDVEEAPGVLTYGGDRDVLERALDVTANRT